MRDLDGCGPGPLSTQVRALLELAAEVGDHSVRRRLPALLETPLTVQQLRALTLLAVHGSASPHQLSDLLQVSAATLTGIADRLERVGMITRRADDRDGRGRVLAPTVEGAAVVRELLASDVATDISLLTALTVDELDGLHRGLSGVLRVLQTHSTEP